MDEKDSQIAHHTILTRSRNPRNAHKFGICLFTLRKERQSSLSNQVEDYSVVFPVLRLAAQRLLAASVDPRRSAPAVRARCSAVVPGEIPTRSAFGNVYLVAFGLA